LQHWQISIWPIMDLQQVHLTQLGQRQSFSEMPGFVESTQAWCQTLEQSEQVIIG
jgi:hypothetical protein